MNRDATPSPPAGEGWGEGESPRLPSAPPAAAPVDRTADPSSVSASPSHLLPQGEKASRAGLLRARARAMRKEPTEAERRLWHIVRDRRFSGFKFRRQVPLGPYIVDLVCMDRRLVVEADGGQHAESSYDLTRDNWFRANGFRVRRFWNADIFNARDSVLETLWQDLDGLPRTDPSDTAELRS